MRIGVECECESSLNRGSFGHGDGCSDGFGGGTLGGGNVGGAGLGGDASLEMRGAHKVAPGSLALLGTVRHGAERMMTAVGIAANLAGPFAGRCSRRWHPDPFDCATILLQLLLVVGGAHVVAPAALALLGTALLLAQRVVRLPLGAAGIGSAGGSSFRSGGGGTIGAGGKLAVGINGGEDTAVVGLDLLVVVRGAHVVAPASLALLGTAVLLAERPALSSAVHLQPFSCGSHPDHGGGHQGLLLEFLGLVGVGHHPLLEVEAAHLLVPAALALLGAVGDGAAPAAAVAAGKASSDSGSVDCYWRCAGGAESWHFGVRRVEGRHDDMMILRVVLE